jgi:para-nitrobenzyl esterase
MEPEVETRSGRLRGRESAGIRIFRGIRYARPPRGALRFRPPEAPESWSGVREAFEPGPAAPQYALPWFGWISAAGVPPGQDCLSLNVWSPGLDQGRRPVVVWIHGGGFMVGSGATGIYDGSGLARRGDVVVVTINYRLGALGYVHLKYALGEALQDSSNLGVRDQVAALEWVRDNIERFGGDPGNVTVVGQSAGAMSIGALLGAPRARALFHRAICQSGAADHVLEPAAAAQVARKFVRELGGPPPTHEALGRIPLRRVLQAQQATMRDLSNMERMMVFLPVVDGDVIPEQPLQAVERGEASGIPLMIGTTLDEWRLFRVIDPGVRRMRQEDLTARFAEALASHERAPAPELAVRRFCEALALRGGSGSPNAIWREFQSLRVMHLPADRLAAAQVRGGGSAHTYLFTWRAPGVLGGLGACHGLDIPFVFGVIQHPLARPLTGISDAARRLSGQMQRSWLQFARDGTPLQEGLPDWSAYKPGRRSTMLLGRDCGMSDTPLNAELRLLESWSPPSGA